MLRPRNSVVRQGGLRRRGGVHVATKSGVRQNDRRQTCSDLEEYFAAEESAVDDEPEIDVSERTGK